MWHKSCEHYYIPGVVLRRCILLLQADVGVTLPTFLHGGLLLTSLADVIDDRLQCHSQKLTFTYDMWWYNYNHVLMVYELFMF